MTLSSFGRGRRRWAVTSLLVSLAVATASSTWAEDAGVDASLEAGQVVEERVPDPRTAQIRALMEGTLAATVVPQTLFDVPLDDEDAVRVERVRIRTLLRALDESGRAPAREAVGPATRRKKQAEPEASAVRADIATVDAAEWGPRIELDRARLAFYELPAERRTELLREHAARREAVRAVESEEAERLREALSDQQRTLEAARAARSESERLVAEELARLIELDERVAATRAAFRARHEELLARRDLVLGWQRRVRDAKLPSATEAEADATYDALRRRLRSSRGELDRALNELDSPNSKVAPLGPDPLDEVPAEIPTERARERRRLVERAIAEARGEEHALREEYAAMLLDEISTLNRERLGLLPHLSPEKRDAVTSFTAAGWDQAQSEAWHLHLILRYHRYVALAWLGSIRDSGLGGTPLWRIGTVAVPWFLCVIAFVWWRRRVPLLVAIADERLAEADRNERRTSPSAARRAVRFFRQIRRPLEWLMLFAATLWLLPLDMQGLLEVQLLVVIIGWSLAAALIVDVINALATYSSGEVSRHPQAQDASGLRLRSLRLVGRVAVAFILILVLTARLVGEGTLYSLVLSTCWLAAVPVFLVLVRWWRETVFDRVERVRKKSPLQSWVLANRSGWQSFFAAMIAAVHLFALGAVKVVTNWLSSFDLARRAHAYLFKREVDRLAGGKQPGEQRPLRRAAYAHLSPERQEDEWIACPADEKYQRLLSRATSGRGGVVALVGGRGLGKSTLLRRLGAEVSVRHIDGWGMTLAAVGASVANTEREPPSACLIDEAGALVKPVIGGLHEFDEVLAFARAHSEHTLWVFSIDSIVWPFLRRARDARPLFDEVLVLRPWSEEQIGQLLLRRSALAGVTPTFDALLDKLPPSADEFDRQEALDAKRAGYFRMIWDYARGNPAMALEVWRSSLVEEPDGEVRVRSLHTPDAAQVESLPDAALFILRAVMQLTPATIADVARATRFSEAQVENAFRHGQSCGYLAETQGGGVRVTWAWCRTVLQLMERRRLLVSP